MFSNSLECRVAPSTFHHCFRYCLPGCRPEHPARCFSKPCPLITSFSLLPMKLNSKSSHQAAWQMNLFCIASDHRHPTQLSPQPYAPLLLWGFGSHSSLSFCLCHLLFVECPSKPFKSYQVKFQKTPNFLNPVISHSSQWQGLKCPQKAPLA